MHKTVEPSILYLGTPVVVISTLNEDGTTNIAPMSSAWWLGWSCMIGLDASSKTTENLKRTKACVLNLASVNNVAQVDQLAKLTGSAKVPLHKKALRYKYCKDKFSESGFSEQTSDLVNAKRVAECPIQLEAEVAKIHTFGEADPRSAIPVFVFELKIIRAHVEEQLLDSEHANRIDPDKWQPLIMSFRKFYGLSEQIHDSKLGKGPEEQYAPWKLRGFTGFAKRLVINAATSKYKRL